MAQGTATKSTSMISTTSVVHGVVGGLTGGVVFGLMMQAFGMIPMVAMLVGSEAVAVGWIVHLVNSAIFGAAFGLIAGARQMGLGMQLAMGAAYGLVLWVVGALLLMPARLGMDLFVINEMSVRSLMGHLVFGVILGGVVAILARRHAR
ncbi:MAG: hypothetical protein ACR2FV_09010 [Ornithinimicrobium sp.]|uniref:hypothetical protein n=1 Tax=Ornithinimicrobium sp. TaxID=1977084 RepID=UPI003D9B80BF